ncbi:hypothetical protein [Hyphomonas sp.]|uniref:hypothetical protein n=1 Tax=Hyphomonas sp. TaxID=87 RepID=UPI0032ECE97F
MIEAAQRELSQYPLASIGAIAAIVSLLAQIGTQRLQAGWKRKAEHDTAELPRDSDADRPQDGSFTPLLIAALSTTSITIGLALFSNLFFQMHWIAGTIVWLLLIVFSIACTSLIAGYHLQYWLKANSHSRPTGLDYKTGERTHQTFIGEVRYTDFMDNIAPVIPVATWAIFVAMTIEPVSSSLYTFLKPTMGETEEPFFSVAIACMILFGILGGSTALNLFPLSRYLFMLGSDSKVYKVRVRKS